jgi:small subunit ribosomal protein S19e
MNVLLLKSKLNYNKMTVYDIEPGEYNKKLAEALKKLPEFEMPEWAYFVKTSVARVRPPAEDDFWHRRAASILRQIYIRGVVGVNRLKTRYGGRKNRGMQPEIFMKASGKIIRVILQQAEKAGFMEKVKEKKSGRKLTKQGVKFLESIK